MCAVRTDEQFGREVHDFVVSLDAQTDTVFFRRGLEGDAVQPELGTRFHALLNDVLIKPFPAHDIGPQRTFRTHRNKGSAGPVNQGPVDLFEDGMVAFHHVHRTWRDQACTLKRPTDFLVFFQHEDA